MAHKLPPLRFGYDALEPYIDAETMELHHDKHHKAYVDNLNKALEPYPQLTELTVEDLLHRLDQVPETIRTAVRNNGGGHVNHQFFWDIFHIGAQNRGQPSLDVRDVPRGRAIVRTAHRSVFRSSAFILFHHQNAFHRFVQQPDRPGSRRPFKRA